MCARGEKKCGKENTTVGTENGGPKRRGLPSFYWFPGFPRLGFSLTPGLSLSFSLWWKIRRAPCPVIKLLPVRWEREIHHAEALVCPANPHH